MKLNDQQTLGFQENQSSFHVTEGLIGWCNLAESIDLWVGLWREVGGYNQDSFVNLLIELVKEIVRLSGKSQDKGREIKTAVTFVCPRLWWKN